MPIYAPRGGFLSTADWEDLAKKVVQGDGLGWPGDPRLELRIGVLSNGQKDGHRLEVWRYNEDGTETRVAHWLPRESMMVCYDLARMRLDAPGRVDTVTEIEKHNERLEKDASDRFNELMVETVKHATFEKQRKNDPGAPRLHTF